MPIGILSLALVGSYALVAPRHMHQCGTTSAQLAEIAVTMRRHASLNPNAKYCEPITVDDVLASRAIPSPGPAARAGCRRARCARPASPPRCTGFAAGAAADAQRGRR